MWTLVYNSTLLLHWNVNSLWAVHNEAMREFPYWKYYHFTQRSDCIPLKGDTNRERIRCNIQTQIHVEEDPHQLHYVHQDLNLEVSGPQTTWQAFVLLCHVAATRASRSQTSGIIGRSRTSNLFIFFEHGLWGQLKSHSARPVLPVWQKSPSLCVLMTQRKVKHDLRWTVAQTVDKILENE